MVDTAEKIISDTPTNTGIANPEPSEPTAPVNNGELPPTAALNSAASAPPTVQIEGAKAAKLIADFKKLTGYSDRDVAAYNESSRCVVTTNGGKYRISPKGSQVKILCGPIPPKAEG